MKSRKSTFVVLALSALFCFTNCHTGWSASNEDRIKEFIDETANALKKGVDKFGDNVAALQDYLDHYQWKGILENETTTDPVTLKHLHLNSHGKVAVVRPGERVEGKITCRYDREKCSLFSHYCVVLGLKGRGPQTTIAGAFGASAGKSHETFALIAPAEKGVYPIVFQPVEAYLDATAFAEWRDPQLTKPIGFIIVN